MASLKTIRLTEDSVSELQICHPNGETKWLEIEAWHERWICVRWPLAGHYDVMLKDGRMVSRSLSARKKHPINEWRAANKLDCREWVSEKLGLTKEQLEERFKEHHERMPFRNGLVQGVRRADFPNQIGESITAAGGTSGKRNG